MSYPAVAARHSDGIARLPRCAVAVIAARHRTRRTGIEWRVRRVAGVAIATCHRTPLTMTVVDVIAGAIAARHRTRRTGIEWRVRRVAGVAIATCHRTPLTMTVVDVIAGAIAARHRTRRTGIDRIG